MLPLFIVYLGVDTFSFGLDGTKPFALIYICFYRICHLLLLRPCCNSFQCRETISHSAISLTDSHVHLGNIILDLHRCRFTVLRLQLVVCQPPQQLPDYSSSIKELEVTCSCKMTLSRFSSNGLKVTSSYLLTRLATKDL